MSPFPDYTDNDERASMLASRPVPVRLVFLAALAGLSPVAVLAALIFIAL